jgi:hypothetical protein
VFFRKFCFWSNTISISNDVQHGEYNKWSRNNLSFRSTLVHPRLLVRFVLFNLLFSVFVDRCRFVVSFWPLYRVSFKLRHLITLLVSSIFSYLLRGFLWAKLSCFNQLALRLQMLYSKLFEIWFVYNCWILWRGITIVIKNRDPDSNNMHPIFRYTVPIAIRSLMLALYNI